MATPSPFSGLSTLVQPIDRFGPKTALVRKLTQLYDRTSRDPKTRRAFKDKKLSAAELGLDPKILSRFDKNGDGALDVAEAANWLADPTPHVEMNVEIGRKSLKKPTITLRGSVPPGSDAGLTFRTGKDGRVILQVGQLPIELTAAETVGRPVSRTASHKAAFKRADQNNNNYLEIDEMPYTGQGGPAEFAAMDRDHNGMVFEAEWLAFMELRDVLTDNRLTLSLAASSTDPVTQFDANSDGRLNHLEFTTALRTIKSWDRNGDGRISQDEIPQHFTGTFQIGTAGGNGTARPALYMSGRSPTAPKNGPDWFLRMDRNRDGEVSFREFLGPIAVFRKLDVNQDGFLDLTEAASLK